MNQKKSGGEPRRSIPMRLSGGSTSSKTRVRPIQMEPGLQALLVAEARAAELIARARANRAARLRQANEESQAEIELFRREREHRYQSKLREATQIDQYRRQLEKNRRELLEQTAQRVRQERVSLLNHIIHCVVNRIAVRPHPNTKRVIF